MHLERILLGVLVLYIGTLSPVLKADDIPDDETLLKSHMVYVEPSGVVISKENPAETEILPYRERRSHWTVLLGADYGSYEPLNYVPKFTNQQYREIWGHPDAGLMQGQFTVKRNSSLGSYGITISGGGVDNTNSGQYNTTLNLSLVEVGGSYYFDTLWPEPYVVPYITGGGYTIIYNESLSGNVRSGTTQIAPFVRYGLAFGLSWLDSASARHAFEDGGLEQAYIYAEGMTLFKSSGASDPDFSNSADWSTGIRLEF